MERFKVRGSCLLRSIFYFLLFNFYFSTDLLEFTKLYPTPRRNHPSCRNCAFSRYRMMDTGSVKNVKNDVNAINCRGSLFLRI
jgi:hypothetical protein